MLRRPVAAAVVVVSVACGARTEIDHPGDWTHPLCVSPSGVRLCGFGCPALSPADCLGFGCADAVTFDGADSGAGICWADSAETNSRCDGCGEGDACIERENVWECVPVDVCAALWDLGVRDVCRYADKNRYDDRALPHASGCPKAAGQYHACGGDCPPCEIADRCVGVSPDHPFGLCNGDEMSGYDPAFSCGRGCAVCAVLDVPPEDFSIAFQYGVCMASVEACLDFASRFPGGLGCYDSTGAPFN